jgi:pyruvate dehydrogenase E2 component (dihydrolipoamide acetyltransferase)
MPFEITMPQLSDTMTEGTVVKWHVREGDPVKPNQEIADVETDKATMPMESYEGGTLAYIAAPEGTRVKVGGLLGVVAVPGEDPAEIRKAAGADGASKPSAPVAPSGDDVKGPSEIRPAELSVRPKQAPPAGEPRERLRVSPLARRIAQEKGIDLLKVRGSGPGGRIVRKDVEEFAAAAARPAAAPAQTPPPSLPMPVPRGQSKTVPLSKMRTAIATALQRSKQMVPHFYETIDIDMEAVAALRQRMNQKLEKEQVRLSVMDFVYKATAAALLRHPRLNARFNAEKNELTQYGDVNLGIAVAIPDGLIVPVLRGIDQLGLKEIRLRSLDLFERARAQRLRREELSEATFTVSPLGNYGIRHFSAIINPPEVGILAVGSAEPRAVVRDGQVVARMTMSVTLSADHRAVDGAVAAEFLSTLRELLEEPAMMLA